MMMVPRLVHRFRQLLIILLLLLGITTWRNTSSEVTQEQGRDLSLRKSTNFTKGASEAPPGGAIVLVLSSVGRSGSSFLGELIAQLPNTFYNFEPLHFYDRSTREAVTPRLAWDTVKALSSCRLEKDWLRATARRGLLRSEAGTICQTVDAGEAARCAGDFCRNRTRLVLKDLFMVDTVRRLFPRSLTSVKYEDLCLDAEGVATDLWRFISEDSEAALPPSWSGYIQDHTTPSKASRGPYQTRRDSQKEAEQWRQEIDEELLLGVEKSCGDVIDLLGHNKFHSLANVRNWSFPLRRTPEALYTQTEVL
ncbi:uncharacterized protein LOC119588103 isoform X2 [Penaeus monodon]|uniref:uncharacterized protein LOC119588103 isoform X2 n=1 Tax=Penaeus monodon TaxID=6687 RepID=UPI0018A78EEA|nr:uncharacterized protein LOC119588103 isoform X2 [Penaeus monodon]